jgi:cytochrome oxidase Cu insertion factor (SCO1/SenC/PrrC family)
MGTNAAAPEDLFIHSTRFVLVDPKGALRGVFDGEDPGSKLRIIEAVNRLLRSP